MLFSVKQNNCWVVVESNKKKTQSSTQKYPTSSKLQNGTTKNIAVLKRKKMFLFENFFYLCQRKPGEFFI